MRPTVAFISAVIALAMFWLGYTTAVYKTTHVHLPAAQRFDALGAASFYLRSVDLIDANQTAELRAKLLALARTQLEPVAYEPPSTIALLGSPGFLSDVSANLEAMNRESLPRLTEKLDELSRRTEAQ